MEDLFTEPLYGNSHRLLLNKLGIRSFPFNLRGSVGVIGDSLNKLLSEKKVDFVLKNNDKDLDKVHK